jgi:hypothetical protein
MSRSSQSSRSPLIPLLVTNIIKIGGLYVALRTATQPTPNVIEIGLAAFMMAGAELSENAILNLAGRMFGGGGSHENQGDPK